MKLIIEKSVCVITPTIGSAKLNDAIESVQNQSYSNIRHLIVVDGPEFVSQVPPLIDVTVSPNNTGANGFYGHRIYAAYPHLVNEDYIAFLDEDNWYEPTHIENMVNTLEETNSNFVHSLRKIYNSNKEWICDDNCESLGDYPIFGKDQNGYLVDTSSYLFKRSWLIQTCHLWHNGWGADRNFFNIVRSQTKYVSTGKHTLCYRLDGNLNSPQYNMFLEGNKSTDPARPWNK